MPAKAHGRGHVRKLPSGKFQLRFYDSKGVRHSGGAFDTKAAAWKHYDEAVKPELDGRPFARRHLTLADLVDVFLERHGKVAKPATIKTLRWRMKRPLDEYGDILLTDLEHMTDDLAGFAARQPERFRHAVMSGAATDLRGGRSLRLHDQEPRQTRRAEPADRSSSCSCLHADGARKHCEGARRSRSRRHPVRRGNRTATFGVGGRREARRRPGEACPGRARDQDASLTTRGPDDVGGTRCGRLASGEARHGVRVRRAEGRAVRHCELPEAGVGASD